MRRGVAAGTHQLVVFDVNFDQNQLDIVEKIEPTCRGLSDVCIRTDEKLFATAGWDHRVRIFTLQGKPKPMAVLDYHSDTVNCLDYSSFDPSLLASASSDSRVAVWSLYPIKS